MRGVRDRNPDQPATDHRLLVPVVHWGAANGIDRPLDRRASGPTSNEHPEPRRRSVAFTRYQLAIDDRGASVNLDVAGSGGRQSTSPIQIAYSVSELVSFGHSRREEGA